MATTGSGTSSAITGVGGSYTLAELVTRWRSRLDDTLSSAYLWSNDELTEYADTCQKMLVAEMPILDDKATTDVCSVALVQNDGLIDLNPRILRILEARISGQDAYLYLRTAEYMNEHYVGWDTASATTGTPTILVYSGVGVDKGYLYPLLDVATGTLNLQVYRQPLLDLVYAAHSTEHLEIDKYAHLIIHYIMWQAYLKQDADTYDPKRAEQHRIYWEGQNGLGGDKERIRRMVMNRTKYPSVAAPMLAFS